MVTVLLHQDNDVLHIRDHSGDVRCRQRKSPANGRRKDRERRGCTYGARRHFQKFAAMSIPHAGYAAWARRYRPGSGLRSAAHREGSDSSLMLCSFIW